MPTEQEDLVELSRYACTRLRERLVALEAAIGVWSSVVGAVSDESLAERVGPLGGPYADSTRRALALHVLDELIHHGAEVALVRDLWAAGLQKR